MTEIAFASTMQYLRCSLNLLNVNKFQNSVVSCVYILTKTVCHSSRAILV